MQGIIGTASAQRPVVVNLAGQRDDGTDGYVSDINFLNMASNGTTVNSRAIMRMSRNAADNNNQLEFWTSASGTATKALTIDSSQNSTFGGNVTLSQPTNGAEARLILTSKSAAGNSRTGIVEYDADTEKIFFINESTTVAAMTSGGNVGIGIDSPGTYRLNVVGTALFSGAVEMAGGGAVYQGQKFWLDGGGDTFLESPSSNLMTFTTNAIQRMDIDGNGNVTIGTNNASPNFKLHTPSLNSSFPSYFQIDGDYANEISDVNIQAVGVLSGGGYGSNLKFYTSKDSTLGEKMRIDREGSISIGGFAPSGTPSADYRSLEIGRQGNTITGAPWKSNLYFSTNATVTAGSTAFTYRYASVAPTFLGLEGGDFVFSNAAAGTVDDTITFVQRLKINTSGALTSTGGMMTQTNDNQAGYQCSYTGTGAGTVSMSCFNDTFAIYDETSARYIQRYTPSSNLLNLNGTVSPFGDNSQNFGSASLR